MTESAIVIIESLTVQHNPAQDRIAMFVRHADTEQVLFLTRRLTFGLLNALSQQIQHTQGDARLGCRKRELLDSQWQDFDLGRRSWRIPMTKSGKPRHVPLSGKVLEILAAMPR